MVWPWGLGLLSAILIALGGWDVVGASQIDLEMSYGNSQNCRFQATSCQPPFSIIELAVECDSGVHRSAEIAGQI